MTLDIQLTWSTCVNQVDQKAAQMLDMTGLSLTDEVVSSSQMASCFKLVIRLKMK
jgi:hypothetical protein